MRIFRLSFEHLDYLGIGLESIGFEHNTRSKTLFSFRFQLQLLVGKYAEPIGRLHLVMDPFSER